MDSDEIEDDGGPAFDSTDGFQGFVIPPAPAGADALYPGSGILANGTPSEVMDRLLNGDPLHVSQAMIDRMQDQAILLDARAVLRAAMARVAHDAFYYKGTPPLREWIDQCIDKGIHLVITQLSRAEQCGERIEPDDVPCATELMEGFGIERAMVRRALLHFQSLSLKVRRTFLAIFVEGRSLEDWSALGNGSVRALEEQLIHATEIMYSTAIPSIPPQPDLRRARKLKAHEAGREKREEGRKGNDLDENCNDSGNKEKRKGGGDV